MASQFPIGTSKLRDTSAWRREWPSLVVAAFVYGGYAGVTYFWRELPLVAVIALLAVLSAWHGSLLHEMIHGHLGNGKLAAVLGWPTMNLWLPFGSYRDSHLRHHQDEHLTDPYDDPESWYLDQPTWNRRRAPLRAVLWVNRTLLGRITVGTLLGVAAYFQVTVRLIKAGNRAERRYLLIHLVFVVCTCLWLFAVCGVPVFAVLAGSCFGGLSLTYLRSFAEHCWSENVAGRTAMVRTGPVLSLLFLNNNLHLAHHLRPGTPWHRLPSIARELDADRQAAAGAGLYRGYRRVVQRYALRPMCQPVHPPEAGVMRLPRPWSKA